MNFATRPCAALMLASLLALLAGGAFADDTVHEAAKVPAGQAGLDAASFAAHDLARDLGHDLAQGIGQSPDGSRAGPAVSHETHPDGWTPGSATKGRWDWRDLRAGLSRKLDSGWLLALNYARAAGAALPFDRYGAAAAQADPRPAFLAGGHKALVLSMKRSF